MYDLVHTDQYSLESVKKNGDELNVDLHLGTRQILDTYNEIHDAIHKSVSKYKLISEDKYWLLKIKFNITNTFFQLRVFNG